MSILRCVFLYRENGKFAAPERLTLPFQSGKICRSGAASLCILDSEMQPVEVGLAEAPLFDLQQLHGFQLFEIRANAAFGCTHVLCEPNLSGKAGVVIPCVLEKHRVSELSADGDIFFGENEVRDLSEAMTGCKIGTNDFDIAFSENVADLAAIAYSMTILYVAREVLSPAYPRISVR